MMKKKYLMTGMAAMALAVVAGCSHDDGIRNYSDEEKVQHAQEQLGIEIDPNQDWNMTAKAKASITVNGDYGETYTVKIYANDPLLDGKGYVLAQGKVESGNTFETSFEYALVEKALIVGIVNHNGFTTYRSVPMVDGVMNATLGQQSAAAARGPRRSMAEPSVPHITIPDANYAQSFLEDAKEPTPENVVDNYDNGYDAPATEGHWEGGDITITTWPKLPNFGWQKDPSWGSFNGDPDGLNFYNNTILPLKNAYDAIVVEYDSYNHPKEHVESFNRKIDAFYAIVNALGTERANWIGIWEQPIYGAYTGTESHWVDGTPAHREEDPTYAKKFKITGNYNKLINVLSTEQAYGDARTVYISGKWSLSDLGTGQDGNAIVEQRVGGGAVIVIDRGGELNIPEGKLMTFVNQARLVVMPGGKITGAGKIEVTNGNAEGLEGYNGGSIEIGTFNNNFGKFFNYGTFKCTQYMAGAGGSSFYNHGVAHIKNGGTNRDSYVSTNARIFNACQWYCEDDMRAYILELAAGSYFYVGGQLEMSCGNDGSNDPTYVAMAAGALAQIGDLDNNKTTWIGPTSGYAVLETGGISYMNWEPGTPIPENGGYFINNIAVSVDDKTMGAGQAQGSDTYVALRDYILNGYGSTGNVFDPIGKTPAPQGNGGAVLVNKGAADVQIAASDGFVAGVSGCTPGYNGEVSQSQQQQAEDRPAVWSYAFEDTPYGDYDMNDVVLKVSYHYDEESGTVDESRLDITLCCTGASLNLTVYLDDQILFGGKEVHDFFGEQSGTLINTGLEPDVDYVSSTITTPEDFSFADADFWIDSPVVVGGVHIAKAGQDPHGIVVPADWQWPLEYVCIKWAYPNFIEFARDASTQDETIKGWYKQTATNPVAGKVYTKQ